MITINVLLTGAEVTLLGALVYFAYHGHRFTKNLTRIDQSRSIPRRNHK